MVQGMAADLEIVEAAINQISWIIDLVEQYKGVGSPKFKEIKLVADWLNRVTIASSYY
jgi:hypothetical protein